MHVFNAWLPPPVSQLSLLEKQAFSEAVRRLKDDASSSPVSTLKWISVFNNFLKSKSELFIPDVELFVAIILGLFHTDGNYYVQARWGSTLYKYLRKFSKKLSITVDWRPLYDLLLSANFKRHTSFEGAALKSSHINSLANVIRKCRRYFPKGSAGEIWSEFRPMLEDLSHNVSLEAAGFISLLLPFNSHVDLDFYTNDWFADCLHLWDGVSYCHFWDAQWASLMGRCVRNSAKMQNLQMEQFVPLLFSHFLRTFEVPVGKTSGVYPYQREVTKEVMIAFPLHWSHSIPKDIAKSIVYLLNPNGCAQKHLNAMIDLLEQYYHPSNGGSWTSSLERFLRYMVKHFLKRLEKEQREQQMSSHAEHERFYFLSASERRGFVESINRLIERGKFSKSSSLAKTTAIQASALAYIEPTVVLPLTIAQFHTALDSITATHQLEAAIKTVALSAHMLLIFSAKNTPLASVTSDEPNELLESCKDTLGLALFHNLSGLDANDPPKTIATLQLFCCVFSTIGKIGNDNEGADLLLSIDWAQWLDDFLSRLFTLLLHLEPSNSTIEAAESNLPSFFNKSFLAQGGSFYLHTLALLFSRLTKPLFQQAIKKVSRFVHNQTLPGAAAEVGLLCSAVIYADPQEGVVEIMVPIMHSVLSSLEDCPPTGFSGVPNGRAAFNPKITISAALETTTIYQLNLILLGIMFGGEHVLQCKDLLNKVIVASLDSPSAKVNEAGSYLLSTIFGTLTSYYPVDQYKLYHEYNNLRGIEEWINTKSEISASISPTWHMPSHDEIEFANELLVLHLKDALAHLKRICQSSSSEPPGATAQEKERLRVLLLRIDASLRGVRSCLPDFWDSMETVADGEQVRPYFISGSSGAVVGSVELRKEAANTLHLACSYLLERWPDDSVLLSLIAHSIAVVGNSGSLEYSEWSSAKDSCRNELESMFEPPTNYVTGYHVKGNRRPMWLVIELLFHHSIWRASQARYNWYRVEGDIAEVPSQIKLLIEDLVKLALHNYDAVRVVANSSLKKLFKRFPFAIKQNLPVLLKSLQDPTAPEHAAIGSCAILSSRPVCRYLAEDFDALSNFLLAILRSSHHESIKAQSAISEVFLVFLMRFAGLQGKSGRSINYNDLVAEIQKFCLSVDNTHWRYNLMAHGMLLILSACTPISVDKFAVLNSITGHFLMNLKSEFPPLRPMSISALLFLLQKSKYNENSEHYADQGNKQMSIISVLLEKDFGNAVLKNLSLDHQYADGQPKSMQGRGFGSSDPASSALWVLTKAREWPRTRTWDSSMKGNAFSWKYAKFFKRLLRIGGPSALQTFTAPLQDVLNDLEDRGLQCAAAEVIAGILHSDLECVSNIWDEWLCSLLKKLLTQSTVESSGEWAACIRFSVTGKGRLGRKKPLTRQMILNCLADSMPPLTASSNAIMKHFMFLCTAVNELSFSSEPDEITFQRKLLNDVLGFMRHSAPQVREVIGMAICIVGANLEVGCTFADQSGPDDWKSVMISETKLAAVQCQKEKIQFNDSESLSPLEDIGRETSDGYSLEVVDDIKQAVRLVETVLYFIISAMKSGRSHTLMNVIVELLYPVLCLQETSHKDLSALAKVALQFFKFQVFKATTLSKAVTEVLSAANDTNWHTRIASLTFLQSFIYRHMFLLPMDSLERIWSELEKLLFDPQLEVRELASLTLIGMMKGSDETSLQMFRERQLENAATMLNTGKSRRRGSSMTTVNPTNMHAVVLALSACVLSMPYDIPRWLPKIITVLARFAQESPPHVRTTVRKTISEFRRTHADTWAIQKAVFTEEELEILNETSSSASYFA